MNRNRHHKGVFFRVERAGEAKWRWAITPPTCVQGLYEQVGEVSGREDDAVQAACAAIKQQTGLFSH